MLKWIANLVLLQFHPYLEASERVVTLGVVSATEASPRCFHFSSNVKKEMEALGGRIAKHQLCYVGRSAAIHCNNYTKR